MACKFCNKNVYFDTTWCHTDGGYGDTDYGGIDVNQIAVRVCPNCGEIRIPEKFKDDVDLKNTFIMNTLASMLVNNIKNLDIVGEEALKVKVDELLKLASDNYSERLLDKNGFSFKDGKLFCSCGKELLKADSIPDALFKLSIYKFNYCGMCAKPLKSLDTNLEAEQEPFSAEVKHTKTWDRSED